MNHILFSGFPSVTAVLKNPSRRIISCEYNPSVFERANVKRYQTAELAKVFELCAVRGITPTRSENDALVGGIGISAEAAARQDLPEAPDECFFAYLDGIEDPYNLGDTVRSLYTAGCGGVIVPSASALAAEEKLCRASAGASEYLPIYICPPERAAEIFLARGYKIICSHMSKNSLPLSEVSPDERNLVVIGGERRGISKTLLEAAHCHVIIEYGRETDAALSAASAAAIIGYEISRKIKSGKNSDGKTADWKSAKGGRS